MRPSFRRLAAAALTAAAVLAVPADASIIVFRCGPAVENLCGINPDGSGRQQLTTDGTSDFPYGSPSLTRDASKLAYVFHSELWVLDVASGARTGPVSKSASFTVLRPDGGRIGAIELYPSFTGVGLNPVPCSFDMAGGDRTCPTATATSTLGWTPDGRLLVDRNSGNASGTNGICALTAQADGTHCAPFVAVHPDRNLRSPAVSPDGRFVVATAEEGTTAAGRLVLFDYAGGAPIRDLTTGTTDGSAAWSPDGSAIVFERDRQLYVIAANGAPGSEKALTAGIAPTWGGPPDAPATTPRTGGTGGGTASPLTALKVAPSQRGGRVRVQVTLSRPATVKVVLKTAGRTVGSLTKRNARAGRTTLSVKLNKAGAARLRRARKLRVSARITVQPAGGKATTTTKTVTLRP